MDGNLVEIFNINNGLNYKLIQDLTFWLNGVINIL